MVPTLILRSSSSHPHSRTSEEVSGLFVIGGQGLEAVVVEPSSSSALAQAGDEEC